MSLALLFYDWCLLSWWLYDYIALSAAHKQIKTRSTEYRTSLSTIQKLGIILKYISSWLVLYTCGGAGLGNYRA